MSNYDNDDGQNNAEEGSDNSDIQAFIKDMSEKYLVQIKEDRNRSDIKQIREITELMKEWADKVISTTKDIVSSVQQAGGSNTSPLDGIVEDMKDRQSKMIETIQDTHNRQLEILRVAISEERKESSQAQLLFEQTLKTRYECMVDALHEKVKAEQEARMQRALDNLERSARIESERSKQSFDIQQEAEVTLSKKFKSIVSDLRRSWEEEEIGRALQLEERLRSHYSVVLEHMESQLKMALQLQDHADQQWLEDVEGRNRQQLETFRAFEEKCKRLYDSRLTEFSDTFSRQIGEYEEQLLESGKALASEKSQFESRLRRMKLSCSRWKSAYQRDLHERYKEMTGALEERYISEIDQLLQEIADMNAVLASATHTIDQREKEILKAREMVSSTAGCNTSSSNVAEMREELTSRWNDLKVPVTERVDALVALLDSAQATPQMLAVYETLNSKLSARQPIAQMISRKQYIEYKLKLASRIGGDGSVLSASDRAQLITELTEIQTASEQLMKQYERKFGESYAKQITAGNGLPSPSMQSQQDSHSPFSAATTSGVSPVMSAINVFNGGSGAPSPLRSLQTNSSFRNPQQTTPVSASVMTGRKPIV